MKITGCSTVSALGRALLGGVLVLVCATANATIIYNNWSSNDPQSGNYIVTVEQNAGNSTWDIQFTVDPWNAEGLGLFVDLGDFDLTDTLFLSNVSWDPPEPSGGVAIWDTDTTSNGCGPGCNLNGVSLPIADPDAEWEMVFRLAGQGFDGIQTFNFSINDSALAGITDTDWGLMGVRAQQLCPPGSTLPEGSCGGSDKSYGTGGAPPPDPPDPDPPNPGVPVPGTLLLLGLGLLGLARSRRRP